jgi:hypothetical protein
MQPDSGAVPTVDVDRLPLLLKVWLSALAVGFAAQRRHAWVVE